LEEKVSDNLYCTTEPLVIAEILKAAKEGKWFKTLSVAKTKELADYINLKNGLVRALKSRLDNQMDV